MITQFEINKSDVSRYSHSKSINDTFTVHYEKEEIMYEATLDDKHLLLYGYAFDVRNPEQNVQNTLNNLLSSEDFRDDFHYLNGQFFLVYKHDGQYFFASDAVCITPIYIDKENNRITTEDSGQITKFNSQLRLNVDTLEYERIPEPHNKLKNKRLERVILDLVKEQYKYFEDKSVAVNFRANTMNKGLLALLSPILKNNELYVRDDTELNNRVAKLISEGFNMNLIEHTEKITADYLTNTHLMDFKKMLNDDVDLSDDEIDTFRSSYLLEDQSRRSLVVEYHLLHEMRYHHDLKKNQFIFDPFNVRMIQNRIYKHDRKESFDPIKRIIQILKPMINYYDFSTGKTLQQKYNNLKKDYDKLKSEMKNSVKNYEFIQELKSLGIDISTNLDGSYNDSNLVVQPSSIDISKDDVFEITYKKSKPGMMIVETFFDNPRNAHRIQITVNGETGDVSTYLGGKFINVNKEITVIMKYERDYNAVSWQKAGKIRIAEID